MSAERARRPVVGVMLQSKEGFVEAGPEELAAGERSMWPANNPDFWPVPLRTAVAENTDTPSMVTAAPAAVQGVVAAARRLDEQVDLIVGGCGFMWAAKDRLAGATSTPVIASTLDLLDFVLGMSSEPVGVITYSAAALGRLVEDHPERARIRLLGLDDLPAWSALGRTDYVARGGWSRAELGRELVGRLAESLGDGGELAAVNAILVECAAVPVFRAEIRSVTPLPVFDVFSLAAAAMA